MSENTWEIMKGMELGDVELQMALQCAPVITGVKVSNLLNINSADTARWWRYLRIAIYVCTHWGQPVAG